MLKPFTLRLDLEDMQAAKDLAPDRKFNYIIQYFIKYGINHWEDIKPKA